MDKGDLVQAEKLFKKSLTSKLAIVKEAAAEAFALAQIKDLQYETQEAIAYYQQSLQLDPDNADGWNKLATLYCRTGELDQAINGWQTVLKLGQTHNNQQEIAIKYDNLGGVYDTRGELDKAVEMYQKSLAITESLGDKEKMAAVYGNLGAVYKLKGNKAEAKRYYQKSIELYKYIASPNEKLVQGWTLLFIKKTNSSFVCFNIYFNLVFRSVFPFNFNSLQGH